MDVESIPITRRQVLALAVQVVGLVTTGWAAEVSQSIAPQPYFASVKRAVDALAKLGAPIAPKDSYRLAYLAHQNNVNAVKAADEILHAYTLAELSFDGQGNGRVAPGGAQRILIEQGWQMFLVRISNPEGRKDNITFSTDLAGAGPGHMYLFPSSAQKAGLLDTVENAPLISKMWLISQLYETVETAVLGLAIPTIRLSGLPIEYRVIQLFSRDPGAQRATLTLYRFPTTGDFPNDAGRHEFDFNCLPSRAVTFSVVDTDGRGCVASLTIKDEFGHVYPPQAMRIAPDMFFQEHIYRANGETVRLPDGLYSVVCRRGPEYLRGVQTVKIDATHDHIDVKLQRWIKPDSWGWYSGDTHIHAGGCAHYTVPTEGVSPETMIRHIRGEGLSIGDVLSWGPSWYYQKQFFSGHAVSPEATLEHPELQAANNVSLIPRATSEDSSSYLRYDVEISGFPSSHAGHLVLLRLKQQDYPGTKLIEEWPSWNLPILQWARAQDAVAGYAHCGFGMQVDSTELPNYDIPPMDSIGTQEAIVDVTHGVVDFLSGCDTQPAAELNAWYHMLNCGFKMALVGETDYPCISGERPGVGRSYVRLDAQPVGDEGYEAWTRGLQQGRLYCGDGRSHFLEFAVDGHSSGDGVLELAVPCVLNVRALIAARLEPEPPAEMDAIRHGPINGWHLENARIGRSRQIAVELVINGLVVEKCAMLADGVPQVVMFRAKVTRSSWIALRILPSAHTHPVFVGVDNRPIRASRRSAEWCRACVDKLWEVKSPFIRESEREAAAAAFDHARQVYDQITAECAEEP